MKAATATETRPGRAGLGLVAPVEPSRSVTESEERTQPHPNAVVLYREKGVWRTETELSKVEDWTAVDIRHWIEESTRRAGMHERYGGLMEKLLKVIEQEDISGDLILAGGKDYLAEKASVTLTSKSERLKLPHVLRELFAALDEARDLQGTVTYWDRLWKESAQGHILCEKLETAGGTGAFLRLALEPHPLDDIFFASLQHIERADVMEADLFTDKDASSAGSSIFKVVSVSTRDDPAVVLCNLIYVRSDQYKTTTNYETKKSRKAKRQAKKKKNKAGSLRWELLASVDFAQHGSALPGHWHLNRTSCGDILPHLRIASDIDGSNEQVWHGKENCCPLWWQFVPDGMMPKEIPQRFQHFLREHIAE